MRIVLIIFSVLFFGCVKSQSIRYVAASRAVGSNVVIPDYNIVSFTGVDSFNVYGNSITAGTGASVADSAWAKKLSVALSNLPYKNFGSSGTGLWYSQTEVIKDTFHGISRKPKIFTAGYNDIRFVGSSTDNDSLLMRRFRATFDMVCALQFMKRSSFKTGSDCSVNNALQWNRSSFRNVWNHTYWLEPTKYIAMNTGGSDSTTYIEYSFTGTNLVIAFETTDSLDAEYTWFGSAYVDIDSKTVLDSIDFHNYASGNLTRWGWEVYPPTNCKVYTGLTNTSHTVRVKIRTLRNQRMKIDGFWTLETDTSLLKPVIFGEVMKQADYVTGQSPFDQSSDSEVDACNNVLYQKRNYWWSIGYKRKVSISPINTYFDKSTMMNADKVHPNDTGHRAIKNSHLSIITY